MRLLSGAAQTALSGLGTAGLMLAVVGLSGAPVAAQADRTESVKIVSHCGYSKTLHKEYACRVVTVTGPGYDRQDWFSIGLATKTYPWERLTWQYRWAGTSTRSTSCRVLPDGLPSHPTYRATRYVTAERLTIYEKPHRVRTAQGTKVLPSRVVRLPWGKKDLTIRKIRSLPCSAHALGVTTALGVGTSSPTPIQTLSVVAPASLAGATLNVPVLGARAGTRPRVVVPVGWAAPETLLVQVHGNAAGFGHWFFALRGKGAFKGDKGSDGFKGKGQFKGGKAYGEFQGMRGHDHHEAVYAFAYGLPGPGPAAPPPPAPAFVPVPLAPGQLQFRVQGSFSRAPGASVSVYLAGEASSPVVPVAPGQGVLLLAPVSAPLHTSFTLTIPASVGTVATAHLSVYSVSGTGARPVFLPVTLAPGASTLTVPCEALVTGPTGQALDRVVVTWQGTGGASLSQSFYVQVQSAP